MEGQLPHLHLIPDIAEHLCVQLGLCLCQLSCLREHYLLHPLTGLEHLLVGELVLKFLYHCLLLSQSLLHVDSRTLRLIMVVTTNRVQKVMSAYLLQCLVYVPLKLLCGQLVLLLQLPQLIQVFLHLHLDILVGLDSADHIYLSLLFGA